tara:strand:+ start:3505 stop:4734 length:1230 start_codon:yes stop_codon:yes gene_type:complete
MNITLFTPHSGQKAVIDGFGKSKHKFGIVSCGRQYGKSLLAQNLMLFWLLGNNQQKGAIITPIYNQSKKIFQELSNASNKLIKSSNKADLTIEFINGSSLQFLSAERYDSIRGFSFNYIVIDEAAFIKEEALNEAILPTLSAIGKKCLVISTPKSKNWFYTYWLRGQENNNDYVSFKGVSTDNPYVSQDFILEQQKSLPADIYKQEYEAQFSEATNDVFRGLDDVCILRKWDETKTTRDYFGIDTGLSNDYTVCTILSESGRTKKVLRFTGKSYEESATAILNELRKYNIRGGMVETNGVGQAMYELIRKQYRQTKGFYTSQDSKTEAVRKLIYDIEQMGIELPSKELMPEMYNELSAYTYKVNTNGKLSFSHPSGYKDDLVDSLWLANMARETLGKENGGLYIGNMKK